MSIEPSGAVQVAAHIGTLPEQDERAADSNHRQRLLIISSHFPPDGAAATHRILRLTKGLHGLGWDITVLTTDPRDYLPGARVDNALLARIPAGVTVSRTRVLRGMSALGRLTKRLRRGTPPSTAFKESHGLGAPANPRRKSVSQRFKDAVTNLFSFPDGEIGWFWFSVTRGASLIHRRHIDVILSSSPPVTCHLVAWALRRYSGVKWVADFRDPWSRAPWLPQELVRSWRWKVQRWLEQQTITHADAVILNTTAMRDEFASHYGPTLSQKFYTVPNGYDPELLQLRSHEPCRDHAALVLTHAGSLYHARTPIPLLEALASAIRQQRIPAARVRLNLVGALSRRFGVPEVIERLGLEAVVHLGAPVSHEESLKQLARSDVLVLIQPGTHLQVPAKLYEYMALRKPILALAGPGAVADIIEQGRLGLVIQPDDTAAIERALCELYEDRRRLARLFVPNEAFLRQFDGRVLSQQVDSILSRLCGATRTA